MTIHWHGEPLMSHVKQQHTFLAATTWRMISMAASTTEMKTTIKSLAMMSQGFEIELSSSQSNNSPDEYQPSKLR